MSTKGQGQIVAEDTFGDIEQVLLSLVLSHSLQHTVSRKEEDKYSLFPFYRALN